MPGPRIRLTQPCQNGERHPAPANQPRNNMDGVPEQPLPSPPAREAAVRREFPRYPPENRSNRRKQPGHCHCVRSAKSPSWWIHCATGRADFHPARNGHFRKGSAFWKSVFRPFGVRLVIPTFSVYRPFAPTYASVVDVVEQTCVPDRRVATRRGRWWGCRMGCFRS